jgi:hypothetical protein
VLEQDLILTLDKTGTAHIAQDNFGNIYDRAGATTAAASRGNPGSARTFRRQMDASRDVLQTIERAASGHGERPCDDDRSIAPIL